jgi:hypothetical protein
LIFTQSISCAIAKTGKLNCGTARHTSWNGFAASALKDERDEAIAEISAIAEALKLHFRAGPKGDKMFQVGPRHASSTT